MSALAAPDVRFDRWGLEGEIIELAVLRGRIGSRTRYIAMVSLEFVATYLQPDARDPRSRLDDARVGEIAAVMAAQPDDWVAGTLTVSFGPSGEFVDRGLDEPMGLLRLSRATRFAIEDGRHRQAAIQLALRENPRLARTMIGLELFPAESEARSAALSAALNHAAPSPSAAATAKTPVHTEAARLTAMTMALNGHSRQEVNRYLTDSFGSGHNDDLLDDVFATEAADRK